MYRSRFYIAPRNTSSLSSKPEELTSGKNRGPADVHQGDITCRQVTTGTVLLAYNIATDGKRCKERERKLN